jgi:hypothetical protein
MVQRTSAEYRRPSLKMVLQQIKHLKRVKIARGVQFWLSDIINFHTIDISLMMNVDISIDFYAAFFRNYRHGTVSKQRNLLLIPIAGQISGNRYITF